MRCPNFYSWFLPTALLVSSLEGVQAQEDYIPRNLNDTVEALGLDNYLANYEPVPDAKRSVSNRCQDAVCLDKLFLSMPNQKRKRMKDKKEKE
jgi:hypothetical protein